MASALNGCPPPPDGQISTPADTPPKSDCAFVAARQTLFADWLTWFYQPCDLFAAGL
jgi:hypothetical protein